MREKGEGKERRAEGREQRAEGRGLEEEEWRTGQVLNCHCNIDNALTLSAKARRFLGIRYSVIGNQWWVVGGRCGGPSSFRGPRNSGRGK